MKGDVIQRKLSEVTRLEWRIWLIRSAGTFVAALAGIAACHFALDWMFRPDAGFRTILLIAFLGAIAAIAWREIWERLRSFPTRDEIALEIERRFPNLDGRFISSHQLSRADGGGSPRLIEQLIDDTSEAAGDLDFQHVPDRKVRNQRLMAAGGALFVWIVVLAASPMSRMSVGVWLERLTNPFSTAEYPTKTVVIVEDGDKLIARGDDVELDARAMGIIPSDASIVIRRGDQKPIEQPVTGSGRRFTYMQKAVLDSFRYYWRLGDGRSEEYEVAVVVPPQVRGIQAEYRYPEYTDRPTETVTGGNLEALPGTEATVYVQTNKPVEQGWLRLESGEVRQLTRLGATTFTTVLQITNESSYRVRLVDQHGFENRDPMEYMILPMADGIPRVELREIEERTFVTPYASLPVEIHVSDDYGVTKVQLHMAVMGTPEETIDVPIRSNRTDVIVKPMIRLEPRNLEPNTEIVLWASALDNRVIGDPQQGVSKRVRLEVVTPEELVRLMRERMEALFPRLEDITEEAIESRTSVEDIISNGGASDGPTTGSR